MEKSEKLPNSFTSKLPWAEATHSIWPATLFLLKRNLRSYPFPSKLPPSQAKEVLETLKNAFSSLYFLHSESISPHQKELLFEHFILGEGFEKQRMSGGFIVEDSATFLGLINLEDHLHLRQISFNHNFDPIWKSFSLLEKKLSQNLDFAFSPRFGYLTSDPTVCGTGLTVQAFLHIPALLHLEKFTDFIETLPEGITIKGLGYEEEYLADFILVENTYTLGVSEESTLKLISETAKKFVEAEEFLRKTLTINPSPSLKDKIGRGLGLLSNAYSLQIQETLSSLSLIQLGKELGWIKKAESFHFFDLFFSSRRAYLLESTHNEHITKESIPVARALHIRKELSLLDPSKLFVL